jgi:hypothetical protein
MLKWFRCPDTELITVTDCIDKCRMERRCLTRPTLLEISSEREWTGHPSTTQLLNGTMMEFLKLTRDYAVDPDSRVFALLGTRHHHNLEVRANELNIAAELALHGDRDVIDLLENDPEEGWVITDYKTWGSFRVAKALGLTQVGKRPDPSGERYRVSGKWGKAGDVKQIPVYAVDSSKIDMKESELQLNNYRVMLKDMFSIEVARMQLQVSVRDGGLQVATNRGLTRNSYMMDVRRLKDEDVKAYFETKAINLLQALDCREWEQPCSDWETWDKMRCREYCDVSLYCPQGMSLATGERE